jgi:hypothetical protein
VIRNNGDRPLEVRGQPIDAVTQQVGWEQVAYSRREAGSFRSNYQAYLASVSSARTSDTFRCARWTVLYRLL